MTDHSTVELAAELTIAWLANPSTRASAEDVDAFLKAMADSLAGFAAGPATEDAEAAPDHAPAVTVRKSLASRDHLISMIDGRPYRTLKRHIGTHGLTPDQYRQRYGLKPDYPMVAPGYSEARSETARRLGLGRKPGNAGPPQAEPEVAPVPEVASRPSARKPRAAAGTRDAARGRDAAPD